MCACVYMSMYVYKIIKLIYKFIIFQKNMHILWKLIKLILKIFMKLKYIIILKKIQQHGNDEISLQYNYIKLIFKYGVGIKSKINAAELNI